MPEAVIEEKTVIEEKAERAVKVLSPEDQEVFEQVKLADDASVETLAVPLRISTGVLGAIVTCLPRAMMSACSLVSTIEST